MCIVEIIGWHAGALLCSMCHWRVDANIDYFGLITSTKLLMLYPHGTE